MNPGRTFSTTATIYSSKEAIWKVLLSQWLYQTAWGAELHTSWTAGESIAFRGVWDGVTYTDKGLVLAIENGSYLKYSYWSSFWNAPDVPKEYCFISYRISTLYDNSCELTISQDGFRDEKHYSDTVSLWINTMAVVKSESEKIDLANVNNLVFSKLISIVGSTPGEVYNRSMGDRWTIGQIVEHIILSNSDLKKFLSASTFEPTTPYDLHVQRVRDMMMNRAEKMKSLDFLIPQMKNYDNVLHKQLLGEIQKEIDDCIHTLNFTKRCGSFELPPFGYLSVFEWLNFSVFHISRHTAQIEALSQVV